MSGCRNNKYNPNSQYPDLIFTAYLNGTVVDYITSEFESNTANALLRGISLDSNPEHGFKDEDEIIAQMQKMMPTYNPNHFKV